MFLLSLQKHCDEEMLLFPLQLPEHRAVWHESLFHLPKNLDTPTHWRGGVMRFLFLGRHSEFLKPHSTHPRISWYDCIRQRIPSSRTRRQGQEQQAVQHSSTRCPESCLPEFCSHTPLHCFSIGAFCIGILITFRFKLGKKCNETKEDKTWVYRVTTRKPKKVVLSA